MLIKYYDIVVKSREISNEKIINNDDSSEYNDSMLTDCHDSALGELKISDPLRSCKKRRLETENPRASKIYDNAAKAAIFNKENRFSNVSAPGKIDDRPIGMEITETISQLPLVDLGEDFTSQEISNLPNLDACQIEAILGNSSSLDDPPKIIKSTVTKNFTLEAWSKGQVPIKLHGGTDVEIYGNCNENVNPNANETAETDSSSTGCKGFLKFSKEIRPLIAEENPDINFVEMAKSLTSRWKELSPEERGYYRDLAVADTFKLIDKNFTSRESTRTKKRPSLTSEMAEKNKKRLVDLLENMKNPKIASKNDKTIRKTVEPWKIDMDSVRRSFVEERKNFRTRRKENIILGQIDENFWIARTGSQIWALSIEQLFRGLGLEKSSLIETTRDSLEELVEKWLREKDSMSLLHPVYDLR